MFPFKGQPTSNIFILPLKICLKITKNALNQNIQIFMFFKGGDNIFGLVNGVAASANENAQNVFAAKMRK